MSNIRGISVAILFILFLMIAVIVAQSIYSASGSTDESSSSEENIDQMTEEVIDEISTYLQMRDQKGKFYKINGEYKIQKIALLISPLVSLDPGIDVSQLTIQLDDGETVKVLTYNGDKDNLDSGSLFDHNIWSNMTGQNYGFLSVIDLDNSLIDYNIINENTENVYIVFKLPSDMVMSKYDKIIVTVFPSSGITRSTILEAPMPMKSVITFR